MLFRSMEFFSAVRSFLPSVLFGILMVLCVRFISGFSLNIILKIGLELIVGAAVFLVCTFAWLGKTGDPVFANLFTDLKRKLKG